MKFAPLAVAAGLLIAGCSETDHGGYATPQEGCKTMSATVAQGPLIEGDEVEHVCSNGKIVEAKRDRVRGPGAGKHSNSWFVDDDSLICKDGTEITTGDEASPGDFRDRETCKDHGGNYDAQDPPSDVQGAPEG